MELSDFLALPRVSHVARSPCGTWLAVSAQRTDAKGGKFVSDIWRVPVDGAAPTQLTDGDFNDRAPCFRADGALGFLSNRPTEDGEDEPAERSQVWLWQPDRLEALTDEPLGVSSFAFSGAALVLLAALRPGVPLDQQRELAEDRKKHGPSVRHYKTLAVRHWDHWLPETQVHLVVIDADGRRDLTPSPGGMLDRASLSVRGGKVALVADTPSAGHMTVGVVWVFDLQTGEKTTLGEGGRVSVTGPKLSADGRYVLANRHVLEEGGYGPESLWLFNLETGEQRALAERWDCLPTPVGFSADGSAVYAQAHDQTTVRLYRLPLSTGQPEPVTVSGCVQAVNTDGGGVVGLWSDIRNPPQPFVLTDAGRKMLPLYAPPELGVVVEEETASGTDGARVHGLVVRPAEVEGPLPVLFMVHGGPISQWGDTWHWRWSAAVLASQGYVVALPNPRGSLGYGRAFMEGIWGNSWGDLCYTDLMAFADAIDARDDTDASRVAAMGGSFGGYMMNWFGVMTDRFRCLMCHAGIVDLGSFQGVTDHPGWWRHQQGVSAYTDPEEQGRYSPMRYITRWQTPALIIHGEKDYRCTIDQALQLYTALQMQGVSSELLVFPDEGHWITKPRNVVAWYRAVLEYAGAQLG